MKVLFLTLGPEIIASSRTRVYQYLPHLRGAGWETRVLAYSSAAPLRLRLPLGRAVASRWAKLLWRLDAVYQALQVRHFERWTAWADVLFIQKALLPLGTQKRLRRLGKPMVFDFDDALYADRQNYDAIRFDHQLCQSDLVVLENEHAQQYAESLGCRTLRITGPIDTDRYTPSTRLPGDKATLGWIGSETTLPHLAHIAGALARVGAQCPEVKLKVVGAGQVPDVGLPTIFTPWRLADEVNQLQSFDIGLMPLPDDEWTRGKGGYKLLQYMACGLPCVASPVGINSALIAEGENGFLARTDDEWVQKLMALICQPDLRRQMGQAGRRRAEAEYSFQAATPRLVQAVEHALAVHSRRSQTC
jgi:glycosyltransferase involved in cell wall biosynthesis